MMQYFYKILHFQTRYNHFPLILFGLLSFYRVLASYEFVYARRVRFRLYVCHYHKRSPGIFPMSYSSRLHLVRQSFRKMLGM